MKYICQVCGYVYDEEAEGVPFSELPDDWTCPMCGAPKNLFEAEEESDDGSAVIAEGPESFEKIPAGVLSAIFSNLARGAEKQYRNDEAGLFRKLSTSFSARAEGSPAIEDAATLNSDFLERKLKAVRSAARSASDRGALRAVTWAEKAARIVGSIIERYMKEGEDLLRYTDVWVCSICGFVYIGPEPPDICPVCKVPGWKFERIEGGEV